jgi:GNAT superfamily N-acetyltransferase
MIVVKQCLAGVNVRGSTSVAPQRLGGSGAEAGIAVSRIFTGDDCIQRAVKASNVSGNSPANPRLPLVLRLLRGKELTQAARLVGRAMRDNPANVAAFGMPNAEHRSLAMGHFFVPVLRGIYQRGLVLGAFRSNGLVGICGMARPGFCRPGPIEKVRVFPRAMIGNSIGTPLRILNWVGEWARRDPTEPHWHLGPVAVEPSLQGQGIGTVMLNAFCALVDTTCAASYLETDKRENIRLYQRFGFAVVESAEVLGIPNWFMSRVPGRAV